MVRALLSSLSLASSRYLLGAVVVVGVQRFTAVDDDVLVGRPLDDGT
jgi:hypothetical protein